MGIYCLSEQFYATAIPLQNVQVNAIAALSHTDSDYSERFRYVYNTALGIAVDSENIKLRSCGYKISTSTNFYSGGDPMGPSDGIRAAEKNNPWLLIGPDRSNEFIIATRARTISTPIVSTMASAHELNSLPLEAFSAVPLVNEMAKLAVKGTLAENYGKSFATILDPTCLLCRDFVKFFESEAIKQNLTRVFSTEVTSETPNINFVVAQTLKSKPDFFLLPGYSKQSGFIIAELGKSFPESRFVGSDGWGDGEFGYLTKFPINEKQKGLTVRPGLPSSKMSDPLSTPFSSLKWKGVEISPPFAAFALREIVQKVSQMLCFNRPKSKEEFAQIISLKEKSFFHLRSGLSFYRLENGKLRYDRPAN